MHVDQLLLALLVLLTVSALSVGIFSRLGLGSILGLLMAGVVVGPSGLGLARRAAELREISELGIVLLLFVIGLEMQPQRLWALRRALFGLGAAQVVITGALMAGYARLMGIPTEPAIVLGFGFALSSTAVVVQLLEERGELDTEHGRTTFAILLFQDLAIVPLLALVPALADQAPMPAHGSLVQRIALVGAALVALYIIGRFVLPAALQRLTGDAFALIAMAAVFGAAWLMLQVGLSMALGAFAMGVLLSESPYRGEIERVVEPLKGMLVGLFFIAVGMSIDIGSLPPGGPWLALQLLVLVVIKGVVVLALCLAFGLGWRPALRVALLLPQCGEFGFVIFGAAVAAGLLSPMQFVYAALLISASMAATPLLAKLADRIGADDQPIPTPTRTAL